MRRFNLALKDDMERSGVYTIEDVLPFIVKGKKEDGAIRVYDGKEVKMWSLRYHTFKNSLVCKCCGVTGKYFALEKNKSDPSPKFHFNLYGITVDGNEILMTKDHIHPKSKGGKDHISNMQTMCKPCNAIKMDKIEG